MPKIKEINSLQELQGYQLLWNALLQKTCRATFFQTLEWLTLYWQHFGKEKKLRVFIVEAAGEKIGIFPLCESYKWTPLGNVTTLSYPLEQWGPCYGPIGPNPTATMFMVMQYLQQSRKKNSQQKSLVQPWDRIDLHAIPSESVDRGRTYRAMYAAGLFPRQGTQEKTSLVDLSGGWKNYLSTRSSKQRYRILRNWKQLASQKNVRYVHHRPAATRSGDGDPAWSLYHACETVAEKSWQHHTTDGNTLATESTRTFLREVHATASQQGGVEMHLMYIKEKPVAYAYNYHYQGYVSGFRTGYDQAQKHLGVGSALFAKMLKTCCEEGDFCLDLGVTENRLKKQLRTSTDTLQRLTYESPLDLKCHFDRTVNWFTTRLGSHKSGFKGTKTKGA